MNAERSRRLFLLTVVVLAAVALRTVPSRAEPFEDRRYSDQAERVIRSVTQSRQIAKAVSADYQLTVRLFVEQGKGEPWRQFVFERSGVLDADSERLDIRRFAATGALEEQFFRNQNTFYQYFVYENELRRLWPDTAEKDRRADESVYPLVWLPVLVNLFPDDYLRWADRYEYSASAQFDHTVYEVLHAFPDYEAARRQRDVQNSAVTWGLRPQIRHYINPETHAIDCVERLAYRWDRLRPNSPSYLYRRYISRITEWETAGGKTLPKTVTAEEWKPGEEHAYRSLELRLNYRKHGRTTSNRGTFAPCWLDGMNFIEAELRPPEDYEAKSALNAGRHMQSLLCAQSLFSRGEATRAEQLLQDVEKDIVKSGSLFDVVTFCRVCRFSGEATLVEKAGVMLGEFLRATSTPRSKLLDARSARSRDSQLAVLYLAIADQCSDCAAVNNRGKTIDDVPAKPVYLENALEDVKSLQTRKLILAKAVTEYARNGYWEKAQSLLAACRDSCMTDRRDEVFMQGLAARLDYWRLRHEWWDTIIEQSRARSRLAREKRG